jgi:hypothetical protein
MGENRQRRTSGVEAMGKRDGEGDQKQDAATGQAAGGNHTAKADPATGARDGRDR